MNKPNLSLILFLSLLPVLLFAQGFGTFSEKLILDSPFSQIVSPGETYYLNGKIKSVASGSKLSVVGTMPYGKYDFDVATVVVGNSFSIC